MPSTTGFLSDLDREAIYTRGMYLNLSTQPSVRAVPAIRGFGNVTRRCPYYAGLNSHPRHMSARNSGHHTANPTRAGAFLS